MKTGEVAVAAQVLEAFNPITGPVAFVTLSLPQPWRVTRATVPPDVQTTLREGERRWVAAGETRHVVFDRTRHIHAELVVHVIPGFSRRTLPPLAEKTGAGSMTVGGHAAAFQFGRRREGILSRRLVPAAHVQYYCDRTRRTIVVALSGALGASELRTLLEALHNLQCHGPSGGESPESPEGSRG